MTQLDRKPSPAGSSLPLAGIEEPKQGGPAEAGWLCGLILLATLGLLAIAVADSAGRTGAMWADGLFWAALIAVITAFALRLVMRDADDVERLGLVITLSLFLYAVKVLASPGLFTLPDELQHWRTTHSLLTTGHLFEANPILPVSPHYPGLESITTAVCRLTGLSIFGAGVLVVGAARILLATALYLIYERLSGSARLAGLATLVYLSNPGVLFVDAQYGYESMALALAVAVLCLLPCLAYGSAGPRRWLTSLIAGAVLIFAVVSTHHITSYVLCSVLLLWAVSERFVRPRIQPMLGIWRYALLSLGLAGLWTGLVATQTIDYLKWPLVTGVEQFASLIAQGSRSRHLFQSYAGDVAPRWQQIAATGATMLTLIAVSAGIATFIYKRRTYPYLPLLYVLAILAGLYPASLALRLTPAGVSVGGRAPEFLFLGIGLIAIIGMAGLLHRRRGGGLAAVVSIAIAGTFVGNAVIGYHPIGIVPGRYLVEADTRSFDAQAVAAASWTAAVLGPGHRFAGDRAAQLLLGSYGDQRPITVQMDKRSVAPIYTSEQWSPFEWSLLATDRIGYLWVDHRLATDLPHVGVWFDAEEPDAFHHDRLISVEALDKFDALPGAARVMDAGDIEIVDVGGVTDAQH